METIKHLFHGSVSVLEHPVFGKGKAYNDYGLGFYCTEHVELAKEWACASNKDGYAKYKLRDEEARNKYRQIATQPMAEEETYVIDIIRNNWENGQGI